jgi:hypothetical protein
MKLVLAIAVVLVIGLPVSGQQISDDLILSERATGVLIVAIEEAQQRGADSIDVNDLVLALIIEDQEPNAPLLFEDTPPGVLFPPGVMPAGRAHKAFFSPKVAVDILVKLNGNLPRSKPVPHGTEMQTSPAYDRVLITASKLPSAFHQSEMQVSNMPAHPPGLYQAVVPLDLLAAALKESCEATKMLQEAGITEEKVLQTIRAGGDLEHGTAVDQTANRTDQWAGLM